MSDKENTAEEINPGDYVSVVRAAGPYEKYIGFVGVVIDSILYDADWVLVRFFNTDRITCIDRSCLEKCAVTECPGAVLGSICGDKSFNGICREIMDMYLKKNQDYGDSFHISVERYGLIAALTRMSDKFNRIENLILSDNKGNFESLEDSLRDLASYCIMTVMELKEPVDFENVE